MTAANEAFARYQEARIPHHARSAFYAGWHARKRAELPPDLFVSFPPRHENDFDSFPPRFTNDPQKAKALLWRLLADGPVSLREMRDAAARARILWGAILRAASDMGLPAERGRNGVFSWRLPNENDFDSFLDAGIPNG